MKLSLWFAGLVLVLFAAMHIFISVLLVLAGSLIARHFAARTQIDHRRWWLRFATS